MSSFPDIEIYILKADAEAVQQWLTTVFAEVKLLSPTLWQLTYLGQHCEVQFTPKAEKNFTSLWFKQNHTPWLNDLECARAAHAALGVEIRCQIASWQETEGETASGWVKLLASQEKPFEWF